MIFGATLYTSNGGDAGGECPVLTSVTPALGNLSAIETLLTSNGPSGDTPTGESIDAVVQDLLNLPPNPEGPDSPPIIVLATDGEPDTCAVPNPPGGAARVRGRRGGRLPGGRGAVRAERGQRRVRRPPE